MHRSLVIRTHIEHDNLSTLNKKTILANLLDHLIPDSIYK